MTLSSHEQPTRARDLKRVTARSRLYIAGSSAVVALLASVAERLVLAAPAALAGAAAETQPAVCDWYRIKNDADLRGVPRLGRPRPVRGRGLGGSL